MAEGVTNSIGCAELDELIVARERVVRDLFDREAGNLARACHAMARSFSRGGTLIPLGTGPAATDAAHAAVEFMHPVIVGKRALPAIAPSNDPSGVTTLASLARPDDIALGISHGRRGEKRLRIRMLDSHIEVTHRRELDDAAEIHHRH